MKTVLRMRFEVAGAEEVCIERTVDLPFLPPVEMLLTGNFRGAYAVKGVSYDVDEGLLHVSFGFFKVGEYQDYEVEELVGERGWKKRV